MTERKEIWVNHFSRGSVNPTRKMIDPKFFVEADWRGKKVGLALYEKLINELKAKEYRYAVLDTPSVARKSHEFYERAGLKKISKEELPFKYEYPDRNSYLYLLSIGKQ
ncbi:MAG: GNAT family N-acetyltransferase [Lachnospiraceae bacterium]|nr:GNAT family N-acetyltransferase [Lachnospiraceae bacterium]